ncbi:TIR-like protein FxsC [Kitasatospora sp. NPDC048239]|uniref:TIR-like protein FxsC n=1 Tax=Kitasatospora sp. NPDC048239 TaxID=3364046 RepID=UPI00371C7707
MRPYFFFSYARRDYEAGDAFVDQFFNDLRDELGRIESVAGADELAYRDTERLRLGDNWEQQLAQMLARCRTMVALYSPAYFASLYCGKEWTAFRGRVRRHQELAGDIVPALIPVLWESLPDELPDEVLKIQYVQLGMGETYVRSGLRDLLRTDPLGAEYRQVVRVVAERIRDAAARRLTELPDFDLGAVRGYFPVAAPVRPAPTAGMVRLFVAAGRASDVPAARAPEAVGPPVPAAVGAPEGGGAHRGGWYGPKPWHWAPYHPPTQPSLVVRAQQVITSAGHTTTLEEIGTGLGEKLDQAREDNQISVLLVDPWMAGSDRYRSALREYDDQNHPVTGVMVPSGSDDPSGGPERDALWAGVRGVFRRNWLRRSDPEHLFRVAVPRESFDDQLTIMVTVAQNKLMDDNFDWGDDVDGAAFGFGPGGDEAGPVMPGLAIPAWPPGPRRSPDGAAVPLRGEQDDVR